MFRGGYGKILRWRAPTLVLMLRWTILVPFMLSWPTNMLLLMRWLTALIILVRRPIWVWQGMRYPVRILLHQ